MMVTLPERSEPAQVLSREQAASVRLAVAQWLRSARGVAEARDELRMMRVPPDEIFRRRRAESADAQIAALLRLAVTVVITRGALEPSDRRRYAPVVGNDMVDRIATFAADAHRHVAQLERGRAEHVASIDLDVGDY